MIEDDERRGERGEEMYHLYICGYHIYVDKEESVYGFNKLRSEDEGLDNRLSCAWDLHVCLVCKPVSYACLC